MGRGNSDPRPEVRTTAGWFSKSRFLSYFSLVQCSFCQFKF